MKKILLGNEAIARGAYEAGCHIAAAYPGTPSTEIIETIARDYPEIKSQWSPNEKTALEVAAGASIAGARSLVAMKHVGLNVAADPLFTFSYTGVLGGLVIINADDPGAWSSQDEQDNRHMARAAKIPLLEPSDPNEAKEFTKMAFEMSEKFDVPVMIRTVTRLSHSQGLVEIDEKKEVAVKEFVRDPKKNVMLPAHARIRHKFKEEIQLPALREYSENSGINKLIKRKTKRGIVASGIAFEYVMEVCPDDSVLKIGMPWPLPEKLIREFASLVEELYVVEELDPYLEDSIKAMGIAVKGGKNIIPILGELTPEIVDYALNNAEYKPAVPLYDESKIPARPPVLCKGCPHVFVFEALKKLDLHVNGDIGCYTLGTFPPYSAMHTQGCMGASIGMHLGMEKAHGSELIKKSVAVIGDSTFIHSGITALIDLVYNKGTGTVLILDNRITAMTGHQNNPASGKTLSGEPTFELDLEALAKACGVKRVITLDPRDTQLLEKTISEETQAEEPSVIISKRKCILVK
jgi:indolepyruvate ferredoxin oxidoreductase alpha subunit